MEHYKIVKKTFYGIDGDGELTKLSRYKCYRKIFGFIWVRLQIFDMSPYSASTICSGTDIAFSTLEKAENFIHKYHKNRKKINTYTLETIERIDLTN